MADPSFDSVYQLLQQESRPSTASGQANGADQVPGVLSQLLNKVQPAASAIGDFYTNTLAPAITGNVENQLSALDQLPLPVDSGTIAKLLVPQTPTAAAIDLATLPFGPGTGSAVGRIGRATLGGAVGGLLEGSPGGGALTGAGSGALGEIIAYIARAAARAGLVPGVRSQAERDVASIGNTAARINPAFKGSSTVEGMSNIVGGAASKNTLSEQYQTDVDKIGQDILEGAKSVKRAVAPYEQGKFLKLANEYRDANTAAYNAAGNFKNSVGANQAIRSKEVIAEEIDALVQKYAPQDAGAWAALNRTFGAGTQVRNLLNSSGLINEAGGLDVRSAQQAFNNPDTRTQLQNILTPQQFADLRDALFRGAQPPLTDQPAKYISAAFFGAPGTRETFRFPLIPPRYVGNALSVPSAPFTMGAANLGNPFLQGVTNQIPYVGPQIGGALFPAR